MNRLGLPFRKLSATDIEREYAFTNLPKNYIGIKSEKDCGCINVPLMTRTLYKLGKELGVTYIEDAEVTGLNYRVKDGVEVVYQHGEPIFTGLWSTTDPSSFSHFGPSQ
jgi:sarcosine oxidase/L-pipecolate oxidase